LAGGFFAVYIPADPTADKVNDRDNLPAALPLAYSLNHAMKMTAKLFEIERESHGDFKVVRSVSDIMAAKATGAMSGILHFEGAEPIDARSFLSGRLTFNWASMEPTNDIRRRCPLPPWPFPRYRAWLNGHRQRTYQSVQPSQNYD
jgi:hypothetical protein